jgi:hypothetical protein
MKDRPFGESQVGTSGKCGRDLVARGGLDALRLPFPVRRAQHLGQLCDVLV